MSNTKVNELLAKYAGLVNKDQEIVTKLVKNFNIPNYKLNHASILYRKVPR